MNQEIIDYLKKCITNAFHIDTSLEIIFETPPKRDMWDLAFWCFVLAKELKKSPIEISSMLSKYISDDKSNNIIQKTEAVWPYLNIFLAHDAMSNQFSDFIAKKSLYTNKSWNVNDVIYVDYIGANVWKPLHIGHMCTPNQGQVFVNAFKKLGYTVISDSHIGDWGIIFWKLLVAFEKYGNESELEHNAVEHLFQLYVKISSEAEENPELDQAFRDSFKKLSQGDRIMVDNWARFTKFSIESMNELLSRFWVHPQYDIGESFYEGLWLPKMQDYPDIEFSMSDIVLELIDKKIATKNEDGSVGVVFPEELKIPSCILQKRDGTHGYLASDLASVKYRTKNWDIKKIVYFVDVRQQLHFKQVYYISLLAHWLTSEIEFTHAYNWFISLKDGAMSTRKGKIIKLQDLFDEWEKRAESLILEKRNDLDTQKLTILRKQISIWAIKYWYLKKSREIDVIFDWDEFMTFDGNSGPYIQYAFVRGKKLIEKSDMKLSYNHLEYSEDIEKQLIHKIMEFPVIIQKMTQSYHAHILCNYLYEMTKIFSSLYASLPILDETLDLNVTNSRLVLVEQFIRIIQEWFEILAIPLPDEM